MRAGGDNSLTSSIRSQTCRAMTTNRVFAQQA